MTSSISFIISLGKTMCNLHISAECRLLRDTPVSRIGKKAATLPSKVHTTHITAFNYIFLYTCLLTIQRFLEFRGPSNNLLFPVFPLVFDSYIARTKWLMSNGWMHRWIDGWMFGQMDGWAYTYIYGYVCAKLFQLGPNLRHYGPWPASPFSGVSRQEY